ncbi:MAG TPA: triose-phosphate isomerase [Candidatus Yonathbacteria bacterium]|nr:triose-phosphate isomerase [Candidatus Yonathbacteria bacterium]
MVNIKKQKKLIIANWKMNPDSLKEAISIFSGIKKTATKLRNVQTVVCPPYIFINELQKKVSGHRLVLGAQDVSMNNRGAFTGEISAIQLRGAKVGYVIVGHSERRGRGETSGDVATKIQVSLKEKLIPIVCVGESERDEHAEYLTFLRNEIEESLAHLSEKDISKIIIAYEPIWAVGVNANSADSPEDTEEAVLFIRKVLSEMFSKKIALSMNILYGGSINDKNSNFFLERAGVQGLLVGRASLKPKQFSSILNNANLI